MAFFPNLFYQFSSVTCSHAGAWEQGGKCCKLSNLDSRLRGNDSGGRLARSGIAMMFLELSRDCFVASHPDNPVEVTHLPTQLPEKKENSCAHQVEGVYYARRWILRGG